MKGTVKFSWLDKEAPKDTVAGWRRATMPYKRQKNEGNSGSVHAEILDGK